MNFTNLEQYLNNGIESLVKDAMRKTFKNPKETAFLVQYGLSLKKAETLRHRAEKNGEHIPSFLIASITTQCNLNCTGCYDRIRDASSVEKEMSCEDWGRIFTEAAGLGISAILLAGGEPLKRVDVLEEASRHESILFPVFTNGIMLDKTYVQFFEKHRHLIPIISIEGDEILTDARRGDGVYTQAMQVMKSLKEFDLLFGASITVTNDNLLDVTREEILAELEWKGCKVAVFVEYVPVANASLALNEAGRNLLEERLASLRERREMILISFPGDEKESGGCLAAGRGFFHINAGGGAEPCPFSPYSDTSLKTTTLRKALQSPLFTRLREEGDLLSEHTGGCVLFDQAEYVQALIGYVK
ncbi:radical SAM/SPASM domain-containing protein [Treponema sp. R80B11-R83G3]